MNNVVHEQHGGTSRLSWAEFFAPGFGDPNFHGFGESDSFASSICAPDCYEMSLAIFSLAALAATVGSWCRSEFFARAHAHEVVQTNVPSDLFARELLHAGPL